MQIGGNDHHGCKQGELRRSAEEDR